MFCSVRTSKFCVNMLVYKSANDVIMKVLLFCSVLFMCVLSSIFDKIISLKKKVNTKKTCDPLTSSVHGFLNYFMIDCKKVSGWTKMLHNIFDAKKRNKLSWRNTALDNCLSIQKELCDSYVMHVLINIDLLMLCSCQSCHVFATQYWRHIKVYWIVFTLFYKIFNNAKRCCLNVRLMKRD